MYRLEGYVDNVLNIPLALWILNVEHWTLASCCYPQRDLAGARFSIWVSIGIDLAFHNISLSDVRAVLPVLVYSFIAVGAFVFVCLYKNIGGSCVLEV